MNKAEIPVDSLIEAMTRDGLIKREGEDLVATEKGLNKAEEVVKVWFSRIMAGAIDGNRYTSPEPGKALYTFAALLLPRIGGTVVVLLHHYAIEAGYEKLEEL